MTLQKEAYSMKLVDGDRSHLINFWSCIAILCLQNLELHNYMEGFSQNSEAFASEFIENPCYC